MIQRQPRGCRLSVHILSGAWGTHPKPAKLESLWTGWWMASFWLMCLVCHLMAQLTLAWSQKRAGGSWKQLPYWKITIFVCICRLWKINMKKRAMDFLALCSRAWLGLEKTHFQCLFYNNFMCLVEQGNIPVSSLTKLLCCAHDIRPGGLQGTDNAVFFLDVELHKSCL